MPPVAEELALIIPDYPTFSPLAVAKALQVYRSNVTYWMQEGKIIFYRDDVGGQYVLREEVIRFAREYLKRSVQD